MDKIKRSLHIIDWNVYDRLDEIVARYNEIIIGIVILFIDVVRWTIRRNG